MNYEINQEGTWLDGARVVLSPNCDARPLNTDIDLLSIGAHKFYGPKGVGALFIKKGISLNQVIYGGGQESGYRPGTESISLIAGMSEALKIALENLDSINKLAKENKMPWELSFSYGRGLQSSTLKKWEGKDTNLIEAQKEFISRCEQVSLAREGLA